MFVRPWIGIDPRERRGFDPGEFDLEIMRHRTGVPLDKMRLIAELRKWREKHKPPFQPEPMVRPLLEELWLCSKGKSKPSPMVETLARNTGVKTVPGENTPKLDELNKEKQRLEKERDELKQMRDELRRERDELKARVGELKRLVGVKSGETTKKKSPPLLIIGLIVVLGLIKLIKRRG